MLSFYGGQAGKNFEIAHIFHNKVEMLEDLKMRWNSTVGVGEIVLISYGRQGGTAEDKEKYNANKREDIVTYKKVYNSTLWQKIYTEDGEVGISPDPLRDVEVVYIEEGKNYGLGYKLITSLTGETPLVHACSDVLDANEDPVLYVQDNDSDYPSLRFYLPQSQVLHFDSSYTDPMENGELVKNEWTFTDTIEEDSDQSKLPTIGSINDPLLSVVIPRPWKFQFTSSLLSADQNPKYLFEDIYTGTSKDPGTKKDTKHLDIKLPKAWQWREDIPITSVATDVEFSAKLDKYPSVNEWDGVTRQFKFNVPRPQTIGSVNTKILSPDSVPSVDFKTEAPDSIEHPGFYFNLPRTSNFYYGDLLGKSADSPYVLDTVIEGAMTGDYYINKETGFVYLITKIENSQTTFVYQACLAGADPVVETNAIDPYTTDKKLNPATVVQRYTDPKEKTGSIYTFNVPNAPLFDTTYADVGSVDAGSVKSAIKDTKTVQIDFTIPRGARWFAGTAVNNNTLSATVDGAKNGDFYLYAPADEEDKFRGNIYKFNGTKWEFTGTNIEGPVGDSLNIKASHAFTSTQVAEDSLEAVGTELDKLYPNGIEHDELLSVTYSSPTEGDKAYWYFYVNGKWGRALLTGGVDTLILNSYDAQNQTTKTYSTNYINKLILSEVLESDKEIKTYNAKTIDEKIMNASIKWHSLSELS